MSSAGGKLTPEYRTIQKCKSEVVAKLAVELLSIAVDLEAADFVPRSVVEEITTAGLSHEKAVKLLNCVQNEVEISQSKYQKFREILEKESSRDSLVGLLDKTYEGRLL